MSFSIVHLRRDAERLGHVFVKGNCACHACDLELAAASVTPCHVPVLAALRAVWAAPNVADTLERVAARLQSDAKRYAESEKLQDIGRNAYESIADMVAALECDYDRLEELRMERKAYDEDDTNSTPGPTPEEDEELAELERAAGDCSDRDDAQQRISEDPLSIEITGTWTADTASEPKWSDAYKVRAEILLGTGGPATRIVCELDEHMEPHRAWIQAQDWFLPWTDYVGGDSDTLLTYCRQFYFGEG